MPTLSIILNLNDRPIYWTRTFDDADINRINVRWNYMLQYSKVNKNTYDTTLKGYGNAGHTFGDSLTENERKAVIE